MGFKGMGQLEFSCGLSSVQRREAGPRILAGWASDFSSTTGLGNWRGSWRGLQGGAGIIRLRSRRYATSFGRERGPSGCALARTRGAVVSAGRDLLAAVSHLGVDAPAHICCKKGVMQSPHPVGAVGSDRMKGIADRDGKKGPPPPKICWASAFAMRLCGGTLRPARTVFATLLCASGGRVCPALHSPPVPHARCVVCV